MWPFNRKKEVKLSDEQVEIASQDEWVTALIQEIASKLNVMEITIENAIDMIAKTVAKSEFKTHKVIDGKVTEERRTAYYRLNIRPNPNETGFVFWRKAIKKMFYENEALIVIMHDGSMYLADSFNKGTEVMVEKTFSNITIETNGNQYQLNRSFRMSEVLYLENRNKKAKSLIDRFNELLGDMLAIACKQYKSSNLQKYKMAVPTQLSIKDHKTGKVITQNEYVEGIKDKLKSEDMEIIMESGGMSIDSITGSSKNGDDIGKFIDIAMNISAFAFDIPYDVFVGKTTEKSNAQNDFITFAIEPVMEIIEDSLNASGVSMNDYLEGERIEISRTKIKHYDVLDVANSMDKLFAIGFSFNNLMDLMGMNKIDEDWANEHYVTKNYANEKTSKGGDG